MESNCFSKLLMKIWKSNQFLMKNFKKLFHILSKIWEKIKTWQLIKKEKKVLGREMFHAKFIMKIILFNRLSKANQVKSILIIIFQNGAIDSATPISSIWRTLILRKDQFWLVKMQLIYIMTKNISSDSPSKQVHLTFMKVINYTNVCRILNK